MSSEKSKFFSISFVKNLKKKKTTTKRKKTTPNTMSVSNITNAVEGEEAGESLIRDLKSTISELVQSPLLAVGEGVIPECAYANRLLFTLENIINHGFQYNTGFFRMITGGASSPFDWLERLPDCLPGTQYLIDTAKSATQSSIARVRVFFRLALNDKTMHECIRALSWDQKWTATHYKEWAIMRNPMQLTSLVTKLEPLSAIDFKLRTVDFVVPLARADYWSVANLTLPQKTETVEDETSIIVVSKSSGPGSAAGSGSGKKKKKARRKQQGVRKAHAKQQQQVVEEEEEETQHENAQKQEDEDGQQKDTVSNPFGEDAIAEELLEDEGNSGKKEEEEIDSSNPFATDAIEEELTKEVAEEKNADDVTNDAIDTKNLENEKVNEEEEENLGSDDVTDQLEAFLNQEGISSDDNSGLLNSMASADDLEALLNADADEDEDDNLEFDEGDVSDDINDLEEQLKMLTSN